MNTASPLSALEEETIKTITQINQAENLQGVYKFKSFLTLGIGALSSTLGVAGLTTILYNNSDNIYFPSCALTVAIAMGAVLVNEGLNSMAKYKHHEGRQAGLSAKIDMLREKINAENPSLQTNIKKL